MFENLRKLENVKIRNYNIKNNTLNIFVKNNQIKEKKINNKTLYYFKNNNFNKQLFLKNKYILVELISCFPSVENNPAIIVTGTNIIEETIYFKCKILNVYNNEKQLLERRKTRYVGITNIINDNNYFTNIPLINEITHLDNAIIRKISINVTRTNYNSQPNNWFKMPTFSILDVLDREFIHFVDKYHERL